METDRQCDIDIRSSPAALPGLSPLALIVLYVAVGLLPLLLALLQGHPARSFWRELSSGLAMIGFAMMLVQFLLSGRFPRVSGKVGIDLTMRFHQLVAWTILVFILAHPFLYAVPRLSPDPADAVAALRRMFASPGLRTGVVAWWLMIFLVVMAVWRDRLPFRYEIWRASHGFGAAAIAALSAEHTLRIGTYAADLWLSSLWGILTAIALTSLVRVYAIKPFLRQQTPYRVVANDRVADRMWQVVVEPVDGTVTDFVPGQFVWLNLGHASYSLTEHPFSISSAPADLPRIAFTIKESGDFTNRIGEIPVGTTAYLDGPHGSFTLADRTATRLVFIAGGVGFAPIIGILRQLRVEGRPHPITLIYGNRVETQILYRDELDAMRGTLDLDLQLVLSEPPAGWTGRVGELTPDVLRACLEPVDPMALYLVCGPTPMMDAVESALVGFGVPGSRIVSERFKYD
jgi:predicted ferric reductase